MSAPAALAQKSSIIAASAAHGRRSSPAAAMQVAGSLHSRSSVAAMVPPDVPTVEPRIVRQRRARSARAAGPARRSWPIRVAREQRARPGAAPSLRRATGISALRSVPIARQRHRAPAATRRARSRSSRSCQPGDDRLAALRPRSSPAPAAPRGRSAKRGSTARPARGRGRAVRTSSAPTRITMFGLRRAVISRNWLSIWSPDMDVHPP